MTFYLVVKAIHVAAVVIAFGVVFAYPVILSAARRWDRRNLAFLHRVHRRVGRAVITPAGTVVLVAGLYLAAEGPWGFAQWWVGFGILAIVVILGLTGGFLAPRERRLSELAQRDIDAAGPGEVKLGADYQTLVRRVLAVQMLAAALVLVTVFLMVLGSAGQL